MKRKLLVLIVLVNLIICSIYDKNILLAEERTYIALGDSITYAYGLNKECSYANMYASKKGYRLINYAENGLTSSGLIELIDVLDKTELEKASLISIYIGANDILSIFIETAKYYLGEEYEKLSVDNINSLTRKLNSEEFREKLQNAVNKFSINYKVIIDKIKSINKNIKTFTIYNPYDGIVIESLFTNLDKFNLGLYAEEWILKLNRIIEENSNPIDIHDKFRRYMGEEKIVNAEINITSKIINVDPHPTLEGQKLIYEAFITDYGIEENINKQDNSNINLIPLFIVIALIGGILILLFEYKNKN